MNHTNTSAVITADRIRAQYAKNAAQLAQMAAKARETGKRVSGADAETLQRLADQALRNSTR